jgi:hypothetical protein
MHPIVVLLFDGVADRAHASLGGRTANEAARTPNLDALTARGSAGILYAIGPGHAPSSEVAHWSMLGYLPEEFPNRAVLEALGAEQDKSPEDVFAFAALRPAEERNGELWLTGRPRSGDDDLPRSASTDSASGSPICGAARPSCVSRAELTSASPTPTRFSVTAIPSCARSRHTPTPSEPPGPPSGGLGSSSSSSQANGSM